MSYMVFIRDKTDNSKLISYTGTVHDTKQDTLQEYLQAAVDPEVNGKPFVVII